ncbi:hypothetical protein RRG08_066294 [Elysia crispata]|uniref:Uncharacterized protein n=1 Tax=Elysia crispata TaxID=231223 RepID=A0AAE1AMU9_9GAST|nr:hypothetical protein RRG08_066294 [Elysia crispata]
MIIITSVCLGASSWIQAPLPHHALCRSLSFCHSSSSPTSPLSPQCQTVHRERFEAASYRCVCKPGFVFPADPAASSSSSSSANPTDNSRKSNNNNNNNNSNSHQRRRYPIADTASPISSTFSTPSFSPSSSFYSSTVIIAPETAASTSSSSYPSLSSASSSSSSSSAAAAISSSAVSPSSFSSAAASHKRLTPDGYQHLSQQQQQQQQQQEQQQQQQQHEHEQLLYFHRLRDQHLQQPRDHNHHQQLQQYFDGRDVEAAYFEYVKNLSSDFPTDFSCYPAPPMPPTLDPELDLVPEPKGVEGETIVSFDLFRRAIPLGVQILCMTVAVLLGIIIAYLRKTKNVSILQEHVVTQVYPDELRDDPEQEAAHLELPVHSKRIDLCDCVCLKKREL